MRFVADTITEHYEHIGEMRGEKRGKLIERIALTKKQLEQFENLLKSGVLPLPAYSLLAPPLKRELAEAEAQLKTITCLKSASLSSRPIPCLHHR